MEDDVLKNILKTDAPAEKSAVGKLEYDSDDSLVLADTETLRRYVTAHATDGFSDMRTFEAREVMEADWRGNNISTSED